MGNFNRGRSSGGSGGGGFRRGGFGGNRGSDGPVTMHDAICDNCGKACQVPFRPTSGKPIFCSSCFENNRGSSERRAPEGRNFDRPTNFEERRMFDAVCSNCGDNCQVPFAPRGDKPIYCSNCFGEKKGAGVGNRENVQSQPQYKEQFEALNNKLDRLIQILEPKSEVEVTVPLEVKALKTKAVKKSPKKSKV